MKVQKNKIKLIPFFAISMLVFSCDPPSFTAAEDHIIPVAKAKEMKDAYTGEIAPLIGTLRSTPAAPYDPTQFAYVDLNTLKSYVALLEHVSESNRKEISGVRIYFGAYPGTDANYPGRETVFMVPTVNVGASALSRTYGNLENLPFSIKPSATAGDKYVGSFEIIGELLNNNDNSAAPFLVAAKASPTGATNTSLILDDLQLTPPPR